jgi:putative addiction module CopG family antidote
VLGTEENNDMTVQLPADLEASIQRKVASGRFGDEVEVIREALGALDAREHERFLRLRSLVRDGFESGEGVELTPELMDEIQREAEEAFRRGEQPDPDVAHCTGWVQTAPHAQTAGTQ